MSISRRSLRKTLVLAGCLFGAVDWPGAGVGLLLVAVGVLLHGVTKGYLQQNRVLTTAGPYRFSRNPFYLANGLIDLGILFVIGRLWMAALYLPIWAIAYRSTISSEEERLRDLFGDPFVEYCAWVPRLIPHRLPWPLEKAEGSFDWNNSNLMRGREYARMLGIVLAPAAILGSEWIRREGWGLLAPDRWLALGLLLFLPALWIFKLGLAETFRRPERALLPSSQGTLLRLAWTLVVLMPLVAALGVRGERWLFPGALALVIATILGMGTWTRDESFGLARRSGPVVLALFAILLAVEGQVLWIAVLPVLWLGLCVLDDIGRARHVSIAASTAPRRLWGYGRRVASGAVVLFCAVGLLRFWVG